MLIVHVLCQSGPIIYLIIHAAYFPKCFLRTFQRSGKAVVRECPFFWFVNKVLRLFLSLSLLGPAIFFDDSIVVVSPSAFARGLIFPRLVWSHSCYPRMRTCSPDLTFDDFKASIHHFELHKIYRLAAFESSKLWIARSGWIETPKAERLARKSTNVFQMKRASRPSLPHFWRLKIRQYM